MGEKETRTGWEDSVMGEFDFEKGEILTNLTLLEDHGDKFPCPFCIEKHLSKVIGYAEEVSLGEDDKEMKELAEWAREWRRKIQGAKEHSHDNPRTRGFLPHGLTGLTECEKEHSDIRRKLAKCIKKVELKCCGRHTKDYSACECNPVAVCRASIPCP